MNDLMTTNISAIMSMKEEKERQLESRAKHIKRANMDFKSGPPIPEDISFKGPNAIPDIR